MITVRAEYQARFREIARVNEETFQLSQPLVSELVQLMTRKYGPQMEALLVDPNTRELNNNGTVFLDSKGRRISMADSLDDGEVIAFMVAIAGGRDVDSLFCSPTSTTPQAIVTLQADWYR